MSGKAKKSIMGRALITSGLFLKVVQIVCTAAGAKDFGNTVWTAITACFLVGGLLVFGLERRGKTALLAYICAVGALLSLIKTENVFLLYAPLFAMLISYSLMLFTMKKRAPLCGVLSLLCTAALILCAFHVISLSAFFGTALLCAMYIIMAAGLFI